MKPVTFPLASSTAAWMKMWEVAATAPMVIGLRLVGMAQGSSPPRGRDRREVTRMGQEKVDAWYEATVAINRRLFDTNLALTALFWRQLWGGAPSASTVRLLRLGPELLTAGLTPVHRRVVANNRRLSRRA